MIKRLKQAITNWLNHEHPRSELPPVNFSQLLADIRPGDVVLVEGRTRISEVIRVITQSRWTHSALFIGAPATYYGTPLYEQLMCYWSGSPQAPLVLEGLLGQGTVLNPLEQYAGDNLRICRPKGITKDDTQRVIQYAVDALGTEYDFRQLLDLARFLLPWALVPRRWRSTLFEAHAGKHTKTVCSTLIASAFSAVRFPILPHIFKATDGSIRLKARNPKLYTPADFDYSPYFEVLKFPPLPMTQVGLYSELPWEDGVVLDPDNTTPHTDEKEKSENST